MKSDFRPFFRTPFCKKKRLATLFFQKSRRRAGTRLPFFAARVFFGMCGNLHNIAVSTQGVSVERIYGRSIMASFHGVWSLAGFVSGLLGSLIVSRGISPTEHFAGVYAGCFLAMILLIRFAAPSDAAKRQTVREKIRGNAGESCGNADARERRKFALRDPFILLLGVICFVNMGCEGVMFDWSGVYFQQVVRPDESLVRLGYTAALGAMLSSHSKNIPVGVAIAAVSTVGFLGFLFGPPVIGHTAEFLGKTFAGTPENAASVGLRGAFLCAAAFALLSAFIAPRIGKYVKAPDAFFKSEERATFPRGRGIGTFSAFSTGNYE